jgi:hypothetical protein
MSQCGCKTGFLGGIHRFHVFRTWSAEILDMVGKHLREDPKALTLLNDVPLAHQTTADIRFLLSWLFSCNKEIS